jgi:Sec-independent protein translocase protein TatA
MHFLNEIIIAGIVLALFGPKMLQSIAHSAGKGVGKAKQVKDEIMSDLPVDEVSKVTNHLSHVPRSPQHAMQMLMTSDEEKNKSTEPLHEVKTATPERNVESA